MGVSGILFCRSCLCCRLVVRICFSSCCGHMLVDAGVWLVLVFVYGACPTVPAEEELSLLRKVHTGSGNPPPQLPIKWVPGFFLGDKKKPGI